MNVIQQGIITLIKSAVMQQELQLPEGFDIEDAAELIRRHQIVTMAYDGAVRCGISRQHPRMQKMFRSYCKALQISEQQMQEVQRLYAAFEEYAIDYLPLKGVKMKSLYPKPELRLMGDADILIRMEQYERIIPIIKQLGYTIRDETDHEIVCQSSALYLELHKRLIPSYNKDFYAYFGSGWQLARHTGSTRYEMTAEDEFIYLFTHFSKHFRDCGIGCRHVVDLWVYRQSNPNLNEDYIRKQLDKMMLLPFYENICHLLPVWFDDAPGDEKTEIITDVIFKNGSWGQSEAGALSRVIRDSKHFPLGSWGKLLYLYKNVFPPAETVEGKYPFLKKKPWLLPVVWLIRPVRKLLFERKAYVQQAKNIRALNKKNLNARRQMLQYVGLDYNF